MQLGMIAFERNSFLYYEYSHTIYGNQHYRRRSAIAWNLLCWLACGLALEPATNNGA